MEGAKKQSVWDYLALGVILILAELALFMHLKFSLEFGRIFGRDWSIHLINAFKIFHCHFDIGKVIQWYKTSSHVIYYTPFNYLISAAFWEFLKFPPLAAVYASKAVWIFFSALALYAAGKALGESACAGIVAATLGILNGLMLEMAREVSQEFLVPAALAIVIYCYALSAAYQRLFGCIVLGVMLGIGILAKSTLFVFAVPFLIFGLFFSPFKLKARFKKRFIYASCAAFIALGIALSFYLNFFSRFLKEAAGETALSFVEENFSKFFSLSCPFIISPFILTLAIASIVLQLKKKDPFLMHILCTLVVSSIYMMTTRTLSTTYLLPLRVIFALLIVRGFRYVSSIIRFLLAMIVVTLFFLPLQTGKPAIKNETLNRFFYPYDKWMTRTVITPINQGDFDWEVVEEFAILFKNRYAEYGYRDIGYILACGINHLPAIALALTKEKNAWLEDVKLSEEVILVALENNDYNEYKMNNIKARKLIILSLPNETSSEPYKFLHEIFNALKGERKVDFSFPIRWGVHLPGNYKILMLTKNQKL